MNAMDEYNVFLPTGDAKFGDTDYALDSNSMFEFPADMGDIPLHAEDRQRLLSPRRRHRQGRLVHPDEHRAD